MTGNPDHDEAEVRLRDLQRLRSLLRAYEAAGGEPVAGVIERMSGEDRDEARALLARVGPLSEPIEKTAARQEMLLTNAVIESKLLEMRANPQPRVRNGKVVIDPETGKPAPNKAMQRRVEAQLRRLRQLNSKLTGLPVEADEPSSGDV